MATSENGNDFQLVPNPPVQGADPGVVKTRDGGLLIVATSPPVRNVTPNRAPWPKN
jgi:hypothetical protein